MRIRCGSEKRERKEFYAVYQLGRTGGKAGDKARHAGGKVGSKVKDAREDIKDALQANDVPQALMNAGAKVVKEVGVDVIKEVGKNAKKAVKKAGK